MKTSQTTWIQLSVTHKSALARLPPTFTSHQKDSGHIQDKRQIGDIQHSTRLHNHQIQHQPVQRHTSTDKTGEEAIREVGGVGSSPSASGSTFFVGNRPVKVCKKLALSVCEDMRLPQRSMAYGWDEWNGDNKVSGGATRVWGCTFFLSTQRNVSAGSHAHTRAHTHARTHYTLS